MSLKLNKGAGNLDAYLILAFLIFVLIVTPRGKDGKGFFGLNSTSTASRSSESSNRTSYSSSNSNSSRGTESGPEIDIDEGNADRAYQPYQEYIVLENDGDTAVNITGWKLRNGKDKRAYSVYGSLQRFSADVALIPQGTLLLQPKGDSLQQDIILGPNEEAIVTTGITGVRSPYRIQSFKENICTGYIEKLDDYAFQPALQNSCPDPSQEPGLDALDIPCRKFVESLSSCKTPKFDRVDEDGYACDTCLDGEVLTHACAAYIKRHFSYDGCIAYHAGDPDFSSVGRWRIFLGRGWEMWAEDYESIELFDRFDNLVSSESY
jgi:hypothetical protein